MLAAPLGAGVELEWKNPVKLPPKPFFAPHPVRSVADIMGLKGIGRISAIRPCQKVWVVEHIQISPLRAVRAKLKGA